MFKLGIDLGGTKFKFALISENGEITISEKYFVDKEKPLIPQIAEKMSLFTEKENISLNDIEFCGMGVPGTISEDERVAVKVPNLNIENGALADELEKETGIPVKLVQDSRAAAWGEYKMGAGKDYKNVICITLGTGIGTGIVLNGAIFGGALGCAGEIGHSIVKVDGRPCGCGKCGCLETYSAGKGLDMSARELLGADKSAADLFDEVKKGNSDAIDIVNDAVLHLGKTIVSVVNALSPDCLLFSGGLSEQKELYLNPLIDYIKENCYSVEGKSLYIAPAALGENSPVIGSALLPQNGAKKRNLGISASIMCGDILNLASELDKLQKEGIDYVHCDIMDNHFVPNMMFPPYFLNAMRKHSSLTFDYHIMTEKPETIIENLEINKNDIVSVHYESTAHIQRALTMIKEKGGRAALAINPGTPVECITEILPDIDMLLVMTVNPGFAGQKLVAQSLDKIKRAREYMDNLGYKNILIEVDGNCSFENIPKMYQKGADIVVVGTSSVYKKGITIPEALEKIKKSL